MPGVQYEVDIDTVDVQKLLNRLNAGISPMSAMYVLEKDVFPWFVEETVARFAYEGDWRSDKWEPLSEATQRIREDMGYEGDWPINIRTSTLFNYVTTSNETHLLPGGAEMVMPGRAPDTNTHDKYLTAQMGSDKNPRFEDSITPARPVVAWGEEADAMEILFMMSHHIVDVLATGVAY